MSSIAGIVGKSPDFNAAKAMNKFLRQQGEDDFGEFFFGEGGRALLLLRNAKVPSNFVKHSHSNSDTALIFSGEIQNASEATKQQDATGNELIATLYRKYGTNAFAKLDGAFVLALYDRIQKKLFLVRDRLGHKKLCYFQNDDGLIFASSVGGLRMHPDFPQSIDRSALKHYLTYQTFSDDAGFYSEVKKLPAGHYLEYDLSDGTIKVERYRGIDFAIDRSLSLANAATKLRDLMQNAVEKRLSSELPIGALLSGGVDSAIICALLTQSGKGKNIPFFTAVLPGKSYDESALAAATAKFLGKENEHHFLPIDFGNLSLMEQLIASYGEPFGDASMLPTALIMAAAKDQLGVILSGDGADELFGGYERYQLMEMAAKIDRYRLRSLFAFLATIIPGGGESRSKLFRLKRAMQILGTPAKLRYCRIFAKSAELSDLEEWGVYNAHEAKKHDITHYLPEDIFPKIEIASAYGAVNVSSPFLDDEVVDFAAGLPTEYLLDRRNRKKLLRHAFGDILPPDIWDRPKRGFGVPLGNLLRNEWKVEAEKLLFETPDSGYGNIEKLRRCWDEHQNYRCDHGEYIWNELVLKKTPMLFAALP